MKIKNPWPGRQKLKIKSFGGYTLMEAVVYVAILAVFSVIAVNVIIIILGSFKHVRAERAVNNVAMIAFERVVREARSAASITIVQSTFDAHPGRLTLALPDASTREFYIENGALKVKENGVYTGTLTASTIVIDSLVFRHLNHGAAQAVRVEMTLHDTRDTSATRQFADTAVLRGTY